MGVESGEGRLEEQEPMAPTASMETVVVVRIIKVVCLSVCVRSASCRVGGDIYLAIHSVLPKP